MNRVRSGGTGYTIVETMIFLAVSGILFISAMLLVNGQQRKTEFTALVRDFDSKLQSIMGNVASGYYNNPGAVTCTVSATPRRPIITMGASTQGQNEGCTFIGQYIGLTTPPADTFTFTSHAGLRLNDAGEEVQKLADAWPTPITQTVENYGLPNGINAKMRIVGGNDIATIAVTPTFNSYNNGLLTSGSSRVELHAITATELATQTPPIGITNPPTGIEICLLDDSGQTGLILLNSGSTKVTIDNSTGACPW